VGAISVLSILSILSYNVMEELRIGEMNFNAAMDYFSNQILLPLGGLFIAVFSGWFMHQRVSAATSSRASVPRRYTLWSVPHPLSSCRRCCW
jgi:NSS family neurotransmitter:Na+ symporter